MPSKLARALLPAGVTPSSGVVAVGGGELWLEHKARPGAGRTDEPQLLEGDLGGPTASREHPSCGETREEQHAGTWGS